MRRGWARTWLRARAEKGNYVAIAGQRRHTYIHSDATKGAATRLTDGSKSLLLLLLLVRSLRMLEELVGDASPLDGTRWDPRLAGQDHVHRRRGWETSTTSRHGDCCKSNGR